MYFAHLYHFGFQSLKMSWYGAIASRAPPPRGDLGGRAYLPHHDACGPVCCLGVLVHLGGLLPVGLPFPSGQLLGWLRTLRGFLPHTLGGALMI